MTPVAEAGYALATVYPIETTGFVLGAAGGFPSAISGIPSSFGTSMGRAGFVVGQIIRKGFEWIK